MTFLFDRPPLAAAAGLAIACLGATMTTTPHAPARSGITEDAAEVAALDQRYQAAVERNDDSTMAAILHPEFELVLGDGRRYTRDDLLHEARTRASHYERQVEDDGTQTVRVHGDTAIVTARLWLKGRRATGPFDYRLWFTDTYVRTQDGWRYVFGQASLPLP
jgi:ketosteroid isomerase-like protein